MFKIELDPMQLVRVLGALNDTVGAYDLMVEGARKDGEEDISFAYFLQAKKYKKIITSIETQMKEQSK
jgi:hypothetical protein